MIPCPNCGQPMPATNQLGDQRRACSRTCGGQLLNRQKWRAGQERCEDAADLLAQQVDPEEIAARLGSNLVALVRLLQRHRFGPEAAAFERAMRRARRCAA